MNPSSQRNQCSLETAIESVRFYGEAANWQFAEILPLGPNIWNEKKSCCILPRPHHCTSLNMCRRTFSPPPSQHLAQNCCSTDFFLEVLQWKIVIFSGCTRLKAGTDLWSHAHIVVVPQDSIFFFFQTTPVSLSPGLYAEQLKLELFCWGKSPQCHVHGISKLVQNRDGDGNRYRHKELQTSSSLIVSDAPGRGSVTSPIKKWSQIPLCSDCNLMLPLTKAMGLKIIWCRHDFWHSNMILV